MLTNTSVILKEQFAYLPTVLKMRSHRRNVSEKKKYTDQANEEQVFMLSPIPLRGAIS